jgi:hypothetical protein
MTDTTAAPNNRAIIFQARERSMGKLNAASRNALPGKDFAGPGRSYPIEDEGHAKAALSRASEFTPPAEQASIRKKVASKFPGMKVKSLKKAGQISDKQADKFGM